MRTVVDLRLRREAERLAFRFGCEDCVYLQEEQGRCSELFPNDEHLGVRLGQVQHVVFCKKFELL